MKSTVKRVWELRALQDTRKESRRLPRSSRSRCIEDRDGKLNIVGLEAWYLYWRDPYHFLMLTVPWLEFTAWFRWVTVSISGTDETVAYTIHARHMFSPSEILWDHQFVDMFYKFPNGDRYLDYAYFHEAVPIQSIHLSSDVPFDQKTG